MENNNEHNIKKGHFDAFVHAVGSEIEQAQVRLITAANAQMLFHYWKMGNYILYHQNLHGWGGKIIKKLAQAIRFNYPEKKGYSERNLTYMCQFARLYPLNVLRSFIETDSILSVPNIQNITNEVSCPADSSLVGYAGTLRIAQTLSLPSGVLSITPCVN